tara:strand:- start:2612 stop:3286 length:675 start_codon:yes stop_codon:yes gene_type:complete
MIHYHGTPLTPKKYLLQMAGKHFCVSFARPDNLETVLKIGQSVMFDNGAFSAKTNGYEFNEKKYYGWVDKYVCPPHWAVIPDVIDGNIDQQREKISKWYFSKNISCPVYHLHLNLDWLWELVNEFPKVALGSSGIFWQVNSQPWRQRMDQVFEFLEKKGNSGCWIHGMRMLNLSGDIYPLASADSTNVARNFKDKGIHPYDYANKIDVLQTPKKFNKNQLEFFQ